ncbi:MAG TPA: hypothetical protein VFE84_11540 [Patescibacteria group bacterium]|nr:hypothetical protein [Patescibacteria group bacterium]
MRIVKPVLFSISSSLLLVPGTTISPVSPAISATATDTEREPGGPLDAGASLLQVIDAGGSLRALVGIDVTSGSTDAEATVTQADPGARSQGAASGRELGRASLHRGQPIRMLVESDLQPGRENHLFFHLDARGKDGSRAETTLYLRVNLDESLEPREVGGYLEYQGAAGEEVHP